MSIEKNKVVPIVMAGGKGTRLWPLSRELYPKQFLKLTSDYSMLQETLLRLDDSAISEPIIISNEDHRFIVAEQLRLINKSTKNIILEPVGRNTAPAIALAALHALRDGEDPLLLVLASDHVIKDKHHFNEAIAYAHSIAMDDKLVTFGIVPSSPETGYGYIKRGDAIDSHSNVFKVQKFVEKPDLYNAKKYLEAGEYYWNSGMFLFKASKYIKELSIFRPDILNSCEHSISNMKFDSTQDFIRINVEDFSECPDESVDYAVMEKTSDAVVVPLDVGWSDVGSWSALWEVNEKDKDDNFIKGDIFTVNTTGSYISTENSFVATVGVKDIIIVNTKDSLLVINKDSVQDVKKVVDHLKKNNRNESIIHRESYRPWGKKDTIIEDGKYIINKITVLPNGKFSLQQHFHRDEHWVVLSGTALIFLDDQESILTENESILIPAGKIHMLSNPGKIPLEILEIASGSYLGNDDIVRLKDHYNN